MERGGYQTYFKQNMVFRKKVSNNASGFSSGSTPDPDRQALDDYPDPDQQHWLHPVPTFMKQGQSLVRKKTYPPDEVRPWDWSQAYLQSPYHLSKSEQIQLR